MSWPRSRKAWLGAVLLCIGIGIGTGTTAQAEFSASDVYRNASPGVVVIFGYDSAGNGNSGTGSIITADGKVLTNNHVIFDASRKAPYSNIRVFFKPTRVTGDPDIDLKAPYKVNVLSHDETLDLAVLQVIDPPRGLQVIGLSNSEHVEVGDPVAAIGHPGGGGLWTLTTGTISSSRRDGVRDVFQTDAAINPGNSGGPLLDEDSNLVGVNTFVRRVNADGLPLEGLNYSLRSNMARTWLADAGVQVAFVTPSQAVDLPAPPDAPGARPPRVAPEAVAPDGDVAPESALGSTHESAADPVPDLVPDLVPDSVPQAVPQTAAPAPPEFDAPAPRPRPEVRIDPEEGPRAVPPPVAPTDPSLEPGLDSHLEPYEGAREFLGPDGELMFGVPAPDFSLGRAHRRVYQGTFESAEKAFDELDDF